MPGDRPRGVRLRPGLSASPRMVGRLAVLDRDVAAPDVVVPGRGPGDPPAGEVGLESLDGVVGRQEHLLHVVGEPALEDVRDEHARPLCVVVDVVLGPEGVVFAVDPPAPVPRVGDVRRRPAAPVLPAPGLVGEAMGLREGPQRDAPPLPYCAVPVGGQPLARVEVDVGPGHVVCGILSHGVLSSAMVWFGHLHHSRVCDAFRFVRPAAAAPMGAALSLFLPPLPLPVLPFPLLLSPPRGDGIPQGLTTW